MSEFSGKQKIRVENLTAYAEGLIEGLDGAELLERYRIKDTDFMPGDLLFVFDNLFDRKVPIEKIKTMSNKLFNILHDDLQEFPKYQYPENSVIDYMIKDNAGVKAHLGKIKKHIKEINKFFADETISSLQDVFETLYRFTGHYTLMENIVFPEIEKKWERYQCLKLMWSIHDDSRKNIKLLLDELKKPDFSLKEFNRLSGLIFFNINTIIFREENVLFPIMHTTMEDQYFRRMDSQLSGFRLEFVDITSEVRSSEPGITGGNINDDLTVNFSTGTLNFEQIELLFNHLPVDITFVDDTDRVRYFSAPKDRIFPRTRGIIGRKVSDCHPHESVEVVKRIVESFKSGDKDDASFWLRMGPMFILIRYFAVRDSAGNYRGVLEVSQEVSDIRRLEGEKRLLDWE